MIIGNGTIAKVLTDRSDRLYFASGVSNSREERESEYQREKDLLLKQNHYIHIVYFSSLGMFTADTRYFRHKREMELLIKTWPHHTIVRIGNITWNNNNPNTFINFLRDKIKKGEPFEIKDEYRYIVDKDEFLYWINLIPKWNCEMSIMGRRMKVADIVKEIKEGKI